MEVGDLILKNSLSKHFVFHNLVQVLIKKIKEEIPKFEDLKLNIELTLLCCNIVENTVKKKTKVDKEKLVVDACITNRAKERCTGRAIFRYCEDKRVQAFINTNFGHRSQSHTLIVFCPQNRTQLFCHLEKCRE